MLHSICSVKPFVTSVLTDFSLFILFLYPLFNSVPCVKYFVTLALKTDVQINFIIVITEPKHWNLEGAKYTQILPKEVMHDFFCMFL